MAKILSHVWSVARGSVGGITYLSGPDNQIVARQRTTPTNPQTPRQTDIRVAFTAAENLWRAATEAQREGWRNYARTIYYQGPTGQYQLDGRQVFLSNVGTGLYLTTRGILAASPTAAPPVTPGFLNMHGLGVIAPPSGTTGFSVQNLNTENFDVTLYAFRSFAFNPTRMTFSGPFLTETLDSDNNIGVALHQIDFTGLEDGMIYFAKCRLISTGSPTKISEDFVLRAVASSTP